MTLRGSGEPVGETREFNKEPLYTLHREVHMYARVSRTCV